MKLNYVAALQRKKNERQIRERKNTEGETLTADNVKTNCLPWSLGTE